MAQTNNDNKIEKIRKPIDVNIGLFVFLVILVYLGVGVFTFLTNKPVTAYEVLEGSLAVSNRYEGIALRDEVIVDSGAAGYVNYFATEGEKVAFNEVVCCVDETGALRDYLVKNSDDGSNILSEKDLLELKNEMINFSSEFDKKNFYLTYDFKYSLRGDVLKFSNRKLLSTLEEIKAQSNLVIPVSSPSTGIVLYTIDGFERKRPEEVNAEWFNKATYEEGKTILTNNTIVSPGDQLFKLTDNENWSIIIAVEPERYQEIIDEQYVKVKFYKNQYESWAKVEGVEGADDGTYIKLSFTNSMISFVQDRYIEVQLLINADKGLKIPNSSIVQKEFYLVPDAYIVTGGDNGGNGLMCKRFTESGEVTVDFVPTEIYCKKTKAEVLGIDKNSEEYISNPKEYDEKYCYISVDDIDDNVTVKKTDSDDEYVIAQKASLTGVFNINKGYADFRNIVVLTSNKEYSIVQSGTNYGLLPHDYIALDANSVETDDFVYE